MSDLIFFERAIDDHPTIGIGRSHLGKAGAHPRMKRFVGLFEAIEISFGHPFGQQLDRHIDQNHKLGPVPIERPIADLAHDLKR